MKLRPIQFVCLVILLSSLRAVDASVLPAGEYGIGGHSIGTVLRADCAGGWTEITLAGHGMDWGNASGTFILIEGLTGRPYGGARALTQGEWSPGNWTRIGDRAALAPPVVSLAAYRTAWTMKPPAAQCVAIHSSTGRGHRGVSEVLP